LFDDQVRFAFNSAKLDDETRAGLRYKVVEKIQQDPAHSAILIEGHADKAGTPAYNLKLSQKRADAVKEFLIKNGVPADLLYTYAYGQGYFWLPYAAADAENRRVRIIECNVARINRCKSAPEASQSAHAKTR
jgi:outer membrane protein OmpA-like peptidoglycan-associated protein